VWANPNMSGYPTYRELGASKEWRVDWFYFMDGEPIQQLHQPVEGNHGPSGDSSALARGWSGAGKGVSTTQRQPVPRRVSKSTSPATKDTGQQAIEAPPRPNAPGQACSSNALSGTAKRCGTSQKEAGELRCRLCRSTPLGQDGTP